LKAIVTSDIWLDGESAALIPALGVPCALFAGLRPDALAELQLEVERLPPGASLLDLEDPPATARILLDGWAVRSNSLRDGRRQILGLMFAGDLGSSWTPVFGPWDHAIRALTPCRVVQIARASLTELARGLPLLGDRIAQAAAVDAAIVHAWLVNLGQRKAPERIAHLFCELAYRLPGRPQQASTIPLTQQDLADALGMTSVHVNRVLQRLRAEGLIDIRKGAVIVLDPEGLGHHCDFDPSYLTTSYAPQGAS
jgi:CRP-like cAMP-binding protein